MENFDEFWEFLQKKADEHDSWWLDDWLDSQLDEYKNMDGCQECGSKLKNVLLSWSKTSNYVLKTTTECSHCKHVLKVEDHKTMLIGYLKNGEVRQKDFKTLSSEVGYKESHETR